MLIQSQKNGNSNKKQQLNIEASRPPREIFRIRCRRHNFFFISKKSLHVSRDVVFIGLVQLMASNIPRNWLYDNKLLIFVYLGCILNFEAVIQISSKKKPITHNKKENWV